MDVDPNIFLTYVNIVTRFIFENTETFSLDKQHFSLEADQIMVGQITISCLSRSGIKSSQRSGDLRLSSKTRDPIPNVPDGQCGSLCRLKVTTHLRLTQICKILGKLAMMVNNQRVDLMLGPRVGGLQELVSQVYTMLLSGILASCQGGGCALQMQLLPESEMHF